MTATRRQRFGRVGELLALGMLLVKGYRIRHRNWRHGPWELDLVVERRRVVVFVEVKARSSADFGGAAGAVNTHKRQILARGAAAYLSRNGLWDRPCRFDVVTVESGAMGLPLKLRHLRDAFQPNLGRTL